MWLQAQKFQSVKCEIWVCWKILLLCIDLLPLQEYSWHTANKQWPWWTTQVMVNGTEFVLIQVHRYLKNQSIMMSRSSVTRSHYILHSYLTSHCQSIEHHNCFDNTTRTNAIFNLSQKDQKVGLFASLGNPIQCFIITRTSNCISWGLSWSYMNHRII